MRKVYSVALSQVCAYYTTHHVTAALSTSSRNNCSINSARSLPLSYKKHKVTTQSTAHRQLRRYDGLAARFCSYFTRLCIASPCKLTRRNSFRPSCNPITAPPRRDRSAFVPVLLRNLAVLLSAGSGCSKPWPFTAIATPTPHNTPLRGSPLLPPSICLYPFYLSCRSTNVYRICRNCFLPFPSALSCLLSAM